MTTSVLYEDELIRVEQPTKGVVDGHIIITPQQPTNTIAELDNEILTRIGFAANLIASVLFETLGVQGTNLVMNEQPVRCDVLARKEGDTWKHHWAGKQSSPEELADVREKISFNIPLEGVEAEDSPKEQPQTPPQEQNQEVVSQEESDEERLRKEEEEENYLIRQLYRVP